jgi:YfiH family protein
MPAPQLLQAQSTRLGGISTLPFQSLNLGFHTEDEAANVSENRRRFFQSIGASPEQLAESYQVHGKEVYHATAPIRTEGYDALITQTPGLILGVSVADCCPVLVYDPQQQAIAAIHAGWKGTALEIVKHTLEQMMATFGTQPSQCHAYIGTCISQAHYEVDDRVADQFAEAYKTARSTPGKWLLDLKAANRGQLTEMGMLEANIQTSPHCTWADNDRFFSHRKEEGQTGRMMAVIGLI